MYNNTFTIPPVLLYPKLKKIFQLTIVVILLAQTISCTNDTIKKQSHSAIYPTSFNNAKVDELYTLIRKYEQSNIPLMKASAEKLLLLKNDSLAQLLGNYYFIKANYLESYHHEHIAALKKIYPQYKSKNVEFIRLEMDLTITHYYYAHLLDIKENPIRINEIDDYIYQPKYKTARTSLLFGLTSQVDTVKIKERQKILETRIKEVENHKWSIYHSKSYSGLITSYIKTGDPGKAKIALEHATKKNKAHNFLVENAFLLANYGRNLAGVAGISSLTKSIEELIQTGATGPLCRTYRDLGHIYTHMVKDKKIAFEYYTKAAEFSEKYNKIYDLSEDTIYKGFVYFLRTNDYKKSLEYYNTALALMADDDYLLHKMILERKLWSLNILGRKQEAKEMKQKLKEYTENRIEPHIYNYNLTNIYTQLKVNLNEKENEITILTLEKSLGTEQLAKHRLVIATIVLLTFTLIGSILYFIQRIRSLQKLRNTITELSIKSRQLNNSNLRLKNILNRREKINNRLQSFTAALAHDFREPLTSIILYCGLLERSTKNKLEAKETEFLNSIKESSRNLSLMVENLYKHSNNTLILLNKFAVIDLNIIIKNVERDLFAKIESKRAQIKVLPLQTVEGNETLLYQMFQNLIANAIKYHRAGVPPIITIDCKEDNNNLIIRIKDNGIGIPSDKNADIFKLFSRSENTFDIEGHGIGLTLVKEIVEIHNGKIWFISEVGIGTTFYVSFKKAVNKAAITQQVS